jgi:hypothetical protein
VYYAKDLNDSKKAFSRWRRIEALRAGDKLLERMITLFVEPRVNKNFKIIP